MDKVCTVVKAGGDLATATGYAECDTRELVNTLDAIKHFAKAIRLAEATVELQHMTNVLKASKASDGRYW